mmetsp:Transcript_22070/g.86799  ORF Transcript_22070/g.86799 Transcript_22070/m.86799 type:complete len:268 (+) Transcript_22070:1382-2185(+)
MPAPVHARARMQPRGEAQLPLRGRVPQVRRARAAPLRRRPRAAHGAVQHDGPLLRQALRQAALLRHSRLPPHLPRRPVRRGDRPASHRRRLVRIPLWRRASLMRPPLCAAVPPGQALPFGQVPGGGLRHVPLPPPSRPRPLPPRRPRRRRGGGRLWRLHPPRMRRTVCGAEACAATGQCLWPRQPQGERRAWRMPRHDERAAAAADVPLAAGGRRQHDAQVPPQDRGRLRGAHCLHGARVPVRAHDAHLPPDGRRPGRRLPPRGHGG